MPTYGGLRVNIHSVYSQIEEFICDAREGNCYSTEDRKKSVTFLARCQFERSHDLRIHIHGDPQVPVEEQGSHVVVVYVDKKLRVKRYLSKDMLNRENVDIIISHEDLKVGQKPNEKTELTIGEDSSVKVEIYSAMRFASQTAPLNGLKGLAVEGQVFKGDDDEFYAASNMERIHKKGHNIQFYPDSDKPVARIIWVLKNIEYLKDTLHIPRTQLNQILPQSAIYTCTQMKSEFFSQNQLLTRGMDWPRIVELAAQGFNRKRKQLMSGCQESRRLALQYNKKPNEIEVMETDEIDQLAALQRQKEISEEIEVRYLRLLAVTEDFAEFPLAARQTADRGDVQEGEIQRLKQEVAVEQRGYSAFMDRWSLERMWAMGSRQASLPLELFEKLPGDVQLMWAIKRYAEWHRYMALFQVCIIPAEEEMQVQVQEDLAKEDLAKEDLIKEDLAKESQKAEGSQVESEAESSNVKRSRDNSYGPDDVEGEHVGKKAKEGSAED